MMYFFPLISIVVLYFLVAATKPYLQPKMPFKVCAICVAVSLTWFILLGLWLFGYEVSPLFVGVLMGMSITGFMYRLEDVYKRHKVRNFWLVRVVVIVGYFYSVIEFLKVAGMFYCSWRFYLSLLLQLPVYFFREQLMRIVPVCASGLMIVVNFLT